MGGIDAGASPSHAARYYTPADISPSQTRSDHVRMVPAGGHFARPSGAAPSDAARVGGAAAGRRFRQRMAMDEDVPQRPAGARFAPSQPDGAHAASPQAGAHRPSASPAAASVPVVARHRAPERSNPGSVTTASIDISDIHVGTEPLSHGSEALSTPRPADTAEFTAAAMQAVASLDSVTPAPATPPRVMGGAATLASGATPMAPAYTKGSSSKNARERGAGRFKRSAADNSHLKRAAAEGPRPERRQPESQRPDGKRPDGKRPDGNRPDGKRDWRDVLPMVLIGVGIVLLLAAVFIFVRAQLGYREAQATYKELETFVVADDAGDGVPQVDFDELEAINPDTVGWIYAPGTPINYPVVQTTDNTTYLRKLFDGTPNGSGTVFMDCDNTAPGGVDQQTTIYGHHTQDGKMFRAIDFALEQEKFDQIDKVYYITRDATYVCRPLMDCLIEDNFTDARVPTFDDDAAFASYLTAMRGLARSVADDVDERQASAESVLTLVTCSGEIIPRTTRAAMVCTIEERIDRL